MLDGEMFDRGISIKTFQASKKIINKVKPELIG